LVTKKSSKEKIKSFLFEVYNSKINPLNFLMKLKRKFFGAHSEKQKYEENPRVIFHKMLHLSKNYKSI